MGNLRKKLFKQKKTPGTVDSHSGPRQSKMAMNSSMKRERKPLKMSQKSSQVLVDKRTKNEKERDKNLR